MKILLLGDFSGLHKNLKTGLQKLGHEVAVASHGDSWKNIDRDIDFKRILPSVLGDIEYRLRILFKLRSFCNYDVVQLINPFYFYFQNKFFPATIFIDKIISSNRNVFLLAAGDDSFFWRYGRSRLRYTPFEDYLKYDLKQDYFFMDNDKCFNFNKMLAKKVRGVIPIMYEYEISYKDIDNLMPTIPIPIDTEEINYTPNIPKGKIIVFHGLNRYGYKGTRHIEKAFEMLKKKYAKHVEFIINKRMKIKDYLAEMGRANIVIDQTYSYSCGLTALYALAMGKIVLGGAEPESLLSLGITKSPVINVLPNTEDIVNKLENILDQRNDFERIGYESRKFVEEVHHDVKVAQKYLDVWSPYTAIKLGQ